MAATNASGTTTVRYGGMHRQVLALEAVLANGQVIRTGTRAVKTSAGYDLTNLLIGSEGTLAVISELTLRLYPILDHVVAARVAFPTVQAACRAAAALISVGISVTRCELVDAATIAALRAIGSLELEQVPHLLIEFAGSQTSVADDIESMRDLVEAEGGRDVAFESDPTARARLWRARHNAAIALLALAPGSTAMTTDVAVPISELPAAIEAARVALDASGLRGGILGHVGDGSFHVMYLLAEGDSKSIAQAAALNDAVVADALARGGTCTGEHGIGFGKLGYLRREHPELVSLYSGIKSLFDPNGILNPGKLVPEPSAAAG
jgi:D-lactate dehydrogenase (cytochrome)